MNLVSYIDNRDNKVCPVMPKKCTVCSIIFSSIGIFGENIVRLNMLNLFLD